MQLVPVPPESQAHAIPSGPPQSSFFPAQRSLHSSSIRSIAARWLVASNDERDADVPAWSLMEGYPSQ